MSPGNSRIRDHLATERTFIAWVRTDIALLAFGPLAPVIVTLIGAVHPSW